MNEITRKRSNATRRANRVRTTVRGTSARPRLSVTISNIHVSAQVIDDSAHKTLIASTTVGKKNIGKTLTEKATWLGEDIAKKAKSAKVKQVVFDRGSHLYHGRIKALAEAARNAGMEF